MTAKVRIKQKTTTSRQQRRRARLQKRAESFFDSYFKARGIEPAYARENGAYFVTNAEARAPGFKPALSGIVFDCRDPFTGAALAGRIRYETPPVIEGKTRKFNQRRGVAPPLHTLVNAKLLKNARIPLVLSEGETRSIILAQHGVPAIAAPGVYGFFEGGTKCTKLVSLFDKINLKRRRIYIVYDADALTNEDVLRAETKLADALVALGARVHVVRLPCVTADGKTGIDDLIAQCGVTTFIALCEAAPAYIAAKNSGDDPVVRILHDVESEEVSYILEGRLARGTVTMMSGDPGAAKSFVVLSFAADLSRGRMPVTGERCRPLRTLYASTENSAAHVIGPRFRAMKGNDRNLFLLDGAVDKSGIVKAITLGDLTPLDRAIAKYKIDLLVLDPLQSYFGADADFHKANEVRPRMDALARLAIKHDIGVVLIRHLAKASGGRAIHRGLGSIDFTGAVRIELMVGTRADRPNDRAVVTVKNNLGIFAPALRFAIEGTGMSAGVVWKGESDLTLGDLLAPESVTRLGSGVNRAVEFLREQLANGPKERDELIRLAAGEFSEDTLKRASKLMGIDRRRIARGPATWALRGTLKGGDLAS